MEGSFKFYEVGGCVRDEILGLKSKDIDYVAVPDDVLLAEITHAGTMFSILVTHLTEQGFEIFLETPDCFTVRAKFPKDHKHQGAADFVMSRKEVGYIPGTRTPIVVPGTLYDDLERRDFTLNALAKDEDGKIIDFFNGLSHLQSGLLITPLPCEVTFHDDPLRILRAIRFSITKGFTISDEMSQIIRNYDCEVKMAVVSQERIREELIKCFSFDTFLTMDMLMRYPLLCEFCFSGILWLKPTMEKKL
jgi:tRNA nucleotidyltransferase/poly(A) polymerase